MGQGKEHLRICFVPLMFLPLVGGAEIQAEKQARELQKLGHGRLDTSSLIKLLADV